MLTKYANIIRNRELFEIDGCVSSYEIFREKFLKDRAHWRYICNLLYRKIKK